MTATNDNGKSATREEELTRIVANTLVASCNAMLKAHYEHQEYLGYMKKVFRCKLYYPLGIHAPTGHLHCLPVVKCVGFKFMPRPYEPVHIPYEPVHIPWTRYGGVSQNVTGV